MRTVRATATAVTVMMGTSVAAVAAGRRASDAALKAPPGRPLPTEPRLTVHGVTPGRITLPRHLAALRPGCHGLAGDGAHAVVGPVLDVPSVAGTVVRRIERVVRGTIEPGDRVWFIPDLHVGDPGTALGLEHTDVDVPGELGSLPAWLVPGVRDTWVLAVHGLGTTREHTMNLMGFLHRYDFPVLALSYRGDRGAPRSPDGLSHLGESEWRDLDAAIGYAVAAGARRVVLLGWSIGATMALRATGHSGLRERVAGLVLDSPVLSWESTIRALAGARRAPGVLLPLAVRAAQGRTGHRADRHDGHHPGAPAPERVGVPTLIIHGPGDTVAPWAPSRRLAAAQPETVTLHTVDNAPHGAMWNAGPRVYEEALRRFLTPLM